MTRMATVGQQGAKGFLPDYAASSARN